MTITDVRDFVKSTRKFCEERGIDVSDIRGQLCFEYRDDEDQYSYVINSLDDNSIWDSKTEEITPVE